MGKVSAPTAPLEPWLADMREWVVIPGSACDTALGKQVLSEGLVGISSTLLARGARAVVASLWPVSDEIGARLMTDFYRHLLRDSMSAPAAPGAAMRSVLFRWCALQACRAATRDGKGRNNAQAWRDTVNHWINKKVALNDSWGPGAVHTLKTPLGQQPEFWLRPRYLRDAQGNAQLSHFTVDFSSGFLADGWQGVSFTPLGTDAVAGISALPPWDPSQRDVYRRAIDAASASLGDSRTARLEAVIRALRVPSPAEPDREVERRKESLRELADGRIAPDDAA